MQCSLVENDRLVAVAEDPSIEMPTDGTGKDDSLKVASARDEVFDLVTVGDARDVLLNDGAIVEFLCDVVAGGPDELDPASVCPMIWPRAGECGEKRVMHVDDGGWKACDEGWRENLHVARKDDNVNLKLCEQVELV